MDNTERYAYIRVKKRDDVVNHFPRNYIYGIYGLQSKTTVTPTGKKIAENDIKILIDLCSRRKTLSSIPSKRMIRIYCILYWILYWILRRNLS